MLSWDGKLLITLVTEGQRSIKVQPETNMSTCQVTITLTPAYYLRTHLALSH